MEMETAVSRAEQVTAKIGNLPVLPQVALKVMEIVADPEADAGDLEKVISKDQALTARVLKLSNSALFGMRAGIATLKRAIVVLGFNTLKSVVLTTSTESLYRGKKSSFKEKILSEHSLAVGLAARLISREMKYAAIEEAFTAGLLHDIGKVVLDQNLGNAYTPVIERVYNGESGFLEAERDILQMDHAEVGGLVAERWRLAAPLQEAIRLHHDPKQAKLDRTLCCIIGTANACCVKMGMGPERLPDLDLASLEPCKMLGLKEEQLTSLTDQIRESLEEDKELLGLN